MSKADNSNITRRFLVSYTFTDQIIGDQDTIRKEIRNLSFSTAFDPDDLNHWRVTRTTDGQYLLAAQRTLIDEIYETSERAALRKFLYGMDLPDQIDVRQIRIVCPDPDGDAAVQLAVAA